MCSCSLGSSPPPFRRGGRPGQTQDASRCSWEGSTSQRSHRYTEHMRTYPADHAHVVQDIGSGLDIKRRRWDSDGGVSPATAVVWDSVLISSPFTTLGACGRSCPHAVPAHPFETGTGPPESGSRSGESASTCETSGVVVADDAEAAAEPGPLASYLALPLSFHPVSGPSWRSYRVQFFVRKGVRETH